MNKKRDFCKELEKSLIVCLQPGEKKHKYIPGDEDMAIVPVLNKKAQILPIEVNPERREEHGGKKICPRCRSINIIPIQYGYPSGEMYEQHKKGQVKIGGCMVGEDSPRWYCKDCDHEF